MSEIDLEALESDRLVKLVALGSKEASLDTPSFRASINHFHTQILALENWIQENAKVKGKNTGEVSAIVEKFEDSLLSRLLPPPSFLSNGLVESKGYTAWIVNEFQNALKNFAQGVNSLMPLNPEKYLSIYLDMLVQVVKPYKELRENFDYYQGRYDSFVKSFHEIKSRPTTNAEYLREQSCELFQIRKLYLNSSLLLLSGINVTQLKLNEMLSNLIEMTVTSTQQLKNSQYSIKLCDDLLSNFSHYYKWVNALILSSKKVSEDYEKTENRLKQYWFNVLEPSSDLTEYDVNVDPSTLISTEPPKSTNKRGWLFLKTTLGGEGRSTWLKRYCFLQDGLFGMLMLSPCKTYVEESDKFGILLIRATYNPQVDRSFCFDLEIVENKDSTTQGMILLTFQAESLTELKEWITCFHFSKEEASKINSKRNGRSIVRSRFPPRFKEFACTSTTDVDFQTTSIRESYTESLSELINTNSPYRFDFSEHASTLCRTPIETHLTKLSIIAHSFVDNTNIPNAITANLWGCVDVQQLFDSALSKIAQPSEPLRWNPKVYSANYPLISKDTDALAKALFSVILSGIYSKEDSFLMKESCICSLLNGKEYPCILFLTSSKLYFYVNFMGFLYVTYLDLTLITSLQVIEKRTDKEEGTVQLKTEDKFDTTIRLFFSNPYCFCEKIMLLLKNKANNSFSKAETLFENFAHMDEVYRNSREQDISKSSNHLLVRNLEADRVVLLQRKQGFQLSYDSTIRIDLDVPPRALMYLIFGDKSKLFQDIYSITDSSLRRLIVGFWCKEDQKSTIARKVKFKLSLSRAFIGEEQLGTPAYNKQGFMDMVQRITKVEDDFYYEVDQFTGYFSIPLTKLFKIQTKYIIIHRDAGASIERYIDLSRSTSSLFMYNSIVFVDGRTLQPSTSLNFFDRIAKRLLLSVFRNESKYMKIVLHSYVNKVGKHSKLLRAMRLGGQIGIYQGGELPQGDLDIDKIENKVTYTTGLLLKIVLRWLLLMWSKFCIMVLKFFFSIFYGLFTNLRVLNRLIVGGLILSLLLNSFFIPKATFEYWAFRNAKNIANSIVNVEDSGMPRMLYLSELDVLTNSLTEDDLLVQKFLNVDAKNKKKYQHLRHEIALRRNEVLVELSILNNMEKDLIKGDFRNFLLGEVQMCNSAEESHPGIFAENEELRAYCELCCSELDSTDLLQ